MPGARCCAMEIPHKPPQDAELAAHAALEEMFIDEFLTTDMLAYERDDIALLIRQTFHS